jgi:serine/threonine protein kinase
MYDIICQEPFADALDDADVEAAVLQFAKTEKLKWKNGSKKVGASKNAKSLVSELLQPNPNERLGMGAEGADEIRTHGYFANMDWSALRAKSLTIPLDWRPNPGLCSTDLTIARMEEEPAEAIRRMQNEYAMLKEQYLIMQAQLSRGAGASSDAAAPISRKRLNDNTTGEPAARRRGSSRRVSAPAPGSIGQPNAIKFESASKPMSLDEAVTTPPNQQQEQQPSALELFDF